MTANAHQALHWLSQQCRLIDAAARGVVFLGEPESGSYRAVATWPGDFTAGPAVANAAQAAVSQRAIVFTALEAAAAKSGAPGEVAAAPLIIEGRIHGAVAIELPRATNGQRQAIAQMLTAGSAWFGQCAMDADSARTKQLALTTDLIATALAPRRFAAATMALATELATHLGCERVSIGLVRERRVKLTALSHSTGFSDKQQLIQTIEAAMGEALDRETTIACPAVSDQNPAGGLAHAQLVRRHHMKAVLTVPLHRGQELLGAIAFERGAEQPAFDAETVTLCEQIAALLGPILELRRREERPLHVAIRESLHARLTRLFGPGHITLKLATTVAVALVALALLMPGQYQVTAEAVLEGTVERVVAAPHKGFLQSVSARPGDVLAEGATLATLDDRDLRLEQIKWSAKQQQVSSEFRRALAEHDRANVGIMSAQLAQAEAQLALIEKQLARLQLTAPFAGIVVSGDVAKELGAPVERGQALFKIAPLEGYRVILKVDEGDIADVRVGQHGRLTLTAAPGEGLPIVVERVTPVAVADAEANYFRVEARLDRPPAFLRPGMQGVAKVDIESRQLAWIWTHSLFNWLRLELWSWLP